MNLLLLRLLNFSSFDIMDFRDNFNLAVARLKLFVQKLEKITPDLWPDRKEFAMYLIAVKQILIEVNKYGIICILPVKKVVIRGKSYNMVADCFKGSMKMRIIINNYQITFQPDNCIVAEEAQNYTPVKMAIIEKFVNKYIFFVKQNEFNSLLFAAKYNGHFGETFVKMA